MIKDSVEPRAKARNGNSEEDLKIWKKRLEERRTRKV
ncbi:MAG: hypothetical protein UY22_C0050G0015 [Candidatus Amesbacteria bacterium GW2011_GWC1_48_10]|uniref:Uncharacterized protein n=1 Tax=Candidatus Amesbacteria bacterium GW2011_GWC1_48_10 TaxID=1618365 RepID=A0A0G1X8R6_9BACT|nr:MAG: hypothetical protein UY22_C0050G0015 [Candidatus Amesbacteria bacterium GW2011_GWC1_48_10]